MLVRYLGIDPGENGGIAILSYQEKSKSEVALHRAGTEKECWRLIRSLRSITKRNGEQLAVSYAALERVGGYMPQKGKQSDIGSAMFEFGRNYGFWRGCLTAAGIPFLEPTPMQWMKAVEVPRKSREESKTERKRRLFNHALHLFPEAKVTLKTCDALLLAEFCRRNNMR